MAQGALEPTGNPLDLAIEGQGFFHGADAERAALHARRRLSPRAERPIGHAGRRAGALRGGQADSDSAGRGHQWAPMARFRWPAAWWRRWASSRFLPAPSSRRRARTATSRRRESTAAAAKDASVHQGAIEAANQDVVQGSLDLIMMQRQAEMMQRALTVFHTEFNKFATEDLPRI